MIDLGNPFSRPYQDLVDSLEVSIRQGVEQPATDSFVFQSSLTSYELRLPANAVTRVTGLLGGSVFTVFQPEIHYRFNNNRILWINSTEKPQDGSRLEVEYTYRERPSGLTDFNPGSVVGTLVRALAREMKLLYEQMDQAYQRAFIDYASGAALDNVVALLGIQRNQAVAAKGFVTFFRNKAADRPYPIPLGTRVSDEGGRIYVTTLPGVITPDPVEELLTPVTGQITVANRIASISGIWPAAADPDTAPPLATVPVDSKKPFGDSEREIALDPTGGPPPPGELRVRYVAKSTSLPVAAAQPGPEGNVNAQTVTIMPTPPTGIQGVVNDEPITEGKEAESDDQLRERARFHLERLGNATLNAIKFAVLEIDGVEGVEVTDYTLDSSIPLGEVHVSYSGGAVSDVLKVVEDTRAAGILAVLNEITKVLVAGTIYVLPDLTVPASAIASFKAAIVEAINALEIGKPLSVRKLSALVYSVSGLADVAESQLESGGLPLTDPFLVKRTELIRPDETNLKVVLLSGLHVAVINRAAGSSLIDLQVAAGSDVAHFINFTLDLTVSFRARLKTAPDAQPSFIGALNRKAVYTASDTATFTVADADIPGYNPADHDTHLEITIASTAFPGLPGVDAALDLT
jgi:uncharacterized phage protein gp47/JayE